MVDPNDAWRMARSAVRTYGGRGLLRRSAYELRIRTGVLARRDRGRSPGSWPDFAWPARLDVDGVRRWVAARPDRERLVGAAVERADALVAGRLSLYGGAEVSVGWPPAWHRHPLTGVHTPVDRHWSELSDNAPEEGDIKDLWETSRMGWVGTLARAHALTGQDRWVEAFWQAVGDWRAANPPYLGANWMSGQEVALRGIALMVGLSTFGRHPASTGDRLAKAGGLLLDSVNRVLDTLGYAESQRNNHAVSEAAFLWSVAVLCPGLAGRARTLQRAERSLAEAIDDQFGPDGSYAQHSFTYQRLALHALLWVLWAARSSGAVPVAGVQRAVSDSVRLLGRLVDDGGGRLPNTGSNDGALLFRLAEAEIGDFRPLLVHAATASGLPTPVGPGPWDEEAVWFGLPPAADRAGARPEPPPGETAYHVLRGRESHGLLRAGPLRHRLSHADQLHFDLYLGEVNVARDPGSFRYTAPPPWNNALAGHEVHNVPRISGRDQAERRGRFFWLDWPEPALVLRLGDEAFDVIVADLSLPGTPAASIRRLVARIGDSYVVADRLEPAAGSVRWNLPPGAHVQPEGNGRAATVTGGGFAARFEGAAGITRLTPADDDPTSGWESLTYGERTPLVAVIVPVDAGGSAVGGFAPELSSVMIPETAVAWLDALAAATEAAAGRAVERARAFLDRARSRPRS